MTRSNPNVAQLHRATALAREYDAMMGLGSVALGAGFVGAAITGQPGVWIALGVIFYGVIPEWYYRRLGFAPPRRDRTVRLLAGTVVVVAIVVAAVVVDRWLSPPVSLTLLAAAGVIGGSQFLMLRRVGLTALHWIVYAALVACAFAPLLGVGMNGPSSAFVLVVVGLSLIMLGLIDHLRLVRLLGPLPESEPW